MATLGPRATRSAVLLAAAFLLLSPSTCDGKMISISITATTAVTAAMCISGRNTNLRQARLNATSYLFVGPANLPAYSFMTCAMLRFFDYSAPTGADPVIKPMPALKEPWRSTQWNVSLSGANGTQAVDIGVTNNSPRNLRVSGVNNTQVKGTTVGPYKGSVYKVNQNQISSNPETLSWVANYIATYILNQQTGLVNSTSIGVLLSIAIVQDYAAPLQPTTPFLASTASYALIQPVSDSNVTFMMHESQYYRDPATKGRRRSLLQLSTSDTITASTACPGGACVRKPASQVSTTCKAGSRGFPLCLYVCTCT